MRMDGRRLIPKEERIKRDAKIVELGKMVPRLTLKQIGSQFNMTGAGVSAILKKEGVSCRSKRGQSRN